jgi:hypothetical protein
MAMQMRAGAPLVTDHQMGYCKDDIQRWKASSADLPDLMNIEVSKEEAAR